MIYEKQNFVDGNVLEAEQLNHMEDGIEKASMQADWNQSDETAVDYVKNRTHYTGVEIVPEKIVVEKICTHEFGTGIYPTEREFFVDATYTVNLNGKTYENLTPFYYEDEYGKYVAIGANDINSTTQEMPFFIYARDGIALACYINIEYTYHHVEEFSDTTLYWQEIEIIRNEYQKEIIVKLDEKYIDVESIIEKAVERALGQVFVVKDWNENYEYSDKYIKNRTHYMYEDGSETIVVDASGITTSLHDYENQVAYLPSDNPIEFVSGSTAHVQITGDVTFDGYVMCESDDLFFTVKDGEWDLAAYIEKDGSDKYIMTIVGCVTEKTVSVKVTVMNMAVKTLDAKYLPMDEIAEAVIARMNETTE